MLDMMELRGNYISVFTLTVINFEPTWKWNWENFVYRSIKKNKILGNKFNKRSAEYTVKIINLFFLLLLGIELGALCVNNYFWKVILNPVCSTLLFSVKRFCFVCHWAFNQGKWVVTFVVFSRKHFFFIFLLTTISGVN